MVTQTVVPLPLSESESGSLSSGPAGTETAAGDARRPAKYPIRKPIGPDIGIVVRGAFDDVQFSWNCFPCRLSLKADSHNFLHTASTRRIHLSHPESPHLISVVPDPPKQFHFSSRTLGQWMEALPLAAVSSKFNPTAPQSHP